MPSSVHASLRRSARPSRSERPRKYAADGNEVVAKREHHRLPSGEAAERRLRHDGVDEADDREGEREPVGDAEAERQPPLPERIPADASERDREQDLLPGRDRGQRRAADAGGVERGHRRVVHGQADDEEVQRDDGPAPDDDGDRDQQERVEPQLDDRQGLITGRGYSGRGRTSAPARRSEA